MMIGFLSNAKKNFDDLSLVRSWSQKFIHGASRRDCSICRRKVPYFRQVMIRSQVSGGYWMGLPRDFCLVHLPMSDAVVSLVEENGEEYETKYLAERTGLSGGWRKFAIQHRLLEKDAMVFHLIEPSKFKVYILRERFFSVGDGALALVNLAYSK